MEPVIWVGCHAVVLRVMEVRLVGSNFSELTVHHSTVAELRNLVRNEADLHHWLYVAMLVWDDHVYALLAQHEASCE